MKMTHTRLLVSNFTECFRFYRDVMGFAVLWGQEDGTYADFDAGGHKLAMFRRELMAAAIGADKPIPRIAQQDYDCLVFAVDDVDRHFQNLLDKGVEPLNQPHDRKDWGIRCFHFRDPDGNLIEVNHDFGIGNL